MGLQAVTATSGVLGVGCSLGIRGFLALAHPWPCHFLWDYNLANKPHTSLPWGIKCYQILPRTTGIPGLAREAYRASFPSVPPPPPTRSPHHALLVVHFLATLSFQEHQNTLAVPLPLLPLGPAHRPGWALTSWSHALSGA